MKNSLVASLSLLLLAPSAHAKLVNVSNDAEYNEQVLQSEKPCVVKFAADWCGVCQGVKKPYEELADEEDLGHVQFVHVDVDQASDLSKKHGVVGVPTFIFIIDGNKIDEQVGVQDMDGFKGNMREDLNKKFPKTIETNIDAQKSDKDRLEEAVKKQEREAQAQNILDTIIDFIKWIAISIIVAIQYVIDAIKGLFNK
jgi:thioredoxin 1